jgi:hypothetical protein
MICTPTKHAKVRRSPSRASDINDQNKIGNIGGERSIFLSVPNLAHVHLLSYLSTQSGKNPDVLNNLTFATLLSLRMPRIELRSFLSGLTAGAVAGSPSQREQFPAENGRTRILQGFVSL